MNQESSLPTTPPDQQFQWSGGKETIESPNRWKKTGETWLIGLLLPVTLALGWEIAVAQGWSSDRLLPTVSTILNTLWDLLQSGELPTHIANTLQQVFLGFVFGTLTGTVLGSLRLLATGPTTAGPYSSGPAQYSLNCLGADVHSLVWYF